MRTLAKAQPAPLYVSVFLLGFGCGFLGGLLDARRREPVKPPTAARMRPMDVPVRWAA